MNLETNQNGQMSLSWNDVAQAASYDLKICNPEETITYVDVNVQTPEYTQASLPQDDEQEWESDIVKITISALDDDGQIIETFDDFVDVGMLANGGIVAASAGNPAPCGWTHSHTAQEVGAATATHTHTLANLGAEPARSTVSQSEATTGTETTVRGWTAQRVRQAAGAAVSATAPRAHNHDAGNINSGRFGLDRMPTNNSTTQFLRGDGRWAAPSTNLDLNPIRIGPSTSNSAPHAISIGATSRITGSASGGSIAIGQRANAGLSAIALGQDSIAEGQGNVVIGLGARAGNGSHGGIVIGGGSVNTLAGHSFGNILIGKYGRVTHSGVGLFGARASAINTSNPVSRANSQIVMGSPGISTVGFSSWSNVSDHRDKKEISPLSYDPVAFIKGLRPKQFKYDFRQCYRHIVEITETEHNALPEYEKRHRLIALPVYGLKTNDWDKPGEIIKGFEWIEEFPYLGIPPKSEDPTCLESLHEDGPVKEMSLGEIPRFTTLNELLSQDPNPRRPRLTSTFFRDYYEALAAWKLSRCNNPENLTPQEAALPLCNPYPYPNGPMLDENGEVLRNESGQSIYEVDDDGNPTVCGPPDARNYDPQRVQTRTAYFHIVEDEPDGTYAGKRYHNGFIAQEVEELASSMGFDFPGVQYFGHHKDENGVPLGDDAYAFAMEEMTAPIVATLQEVLERVESLEMQNGELRQRNAELESRIAIFES